MATEYRPVEATESDSASLLESSLESGQTEKSEYVHPKSKSEKYRLRLVLEVCMAVVIIVLLVGVNNIRTSLGRNEDHNRIIPKFSQKLETFLPDVRFLAEDGSENARRESKRFWMKLVPQGLGFIAVNDYKKHDLPPPIDLWEQHVYSTSVTHQLHCLHSIMETLDDYRFNGTVQKEHHEPWHLVHCFDYLRQSIMCCGDTSLEGMATSFPSKMKGSDGFHVQHVCKDYSEIYRWLKDHRATNMSWI